MLVRKAEREAMVALLESDHEDVEALAGEALKLAWSHLMQRQWWCGVLYQPRVGTKLHGPFESQSMAFRFAHTLAAADQDAVYAVHRLYDSSVTLTLEDA